MTRRLLAIAWLLAFVGGFADAASYILTKSFTGHVTGNTVLLAIHLVQMQWREAGVSAGAIVAFLAGTGSAEWLEISPGAPAAARQLRGPLLWEGALLLIAVGCLAQARVIGDAPGIVLFCLALGLQNGALQKCGGASVHTTFITGMSTTWVTAEARYLSGQERWADRHKHLPARLGWMLLAFVAGAAAGGWLASHFHARGLTGIFVPLAGAFAIACADAEDNPTSPDQAAAS